jgi:hypothetical protein
MTRQTEYSDRDTPQQPDPVARDMKSLADMLA